MTIAPFALGVSVGAAFSITCLVLAQPGVTPPPIPPPPAAPWPLTVIRTHDTTGPGGIPDGLVNAHDNAALLASWNQTPVIERTYIMPDVTGFWVLIRDENGNQVSVARTILTVRIAGQELGQTSFSSHHVHTMELWVK